MASVRTWNIRRAFTEAVGGEASVAAGYVEGDDLVGERGAVAFGHMHDDGAGKNGINLGGLRIARQDHHLRRIRWNRDLRDGDLFHDGVAEIVGGLCGDDVLAQGQRHGTGAKGAVVSEADIDDGGDAVDGHGQAHEPALHVRHPPGHINGLRGDLRAVRGKVNEQRRPGRILGDGDRRGCGPYAATKDSGDKELAGYVGLDLEFGRKRASCNGC